MRRGGRDMERREGREGGLTHLAGLEGRGDRRVRRGGRDIERREGSED